MSRQRTRKTPVGIQLFPFLAVLICTMGALIVLLVLVVSQARVHADAIAEDRVQRQQTQAAEQTQLRQAQEDSEWRREVLTQQRQELQQRLADQRLELSHLEDHIRRLEQKLQQLKLQGDQWQRLGSGRQQEQAALQSTLARLQTEIEQERQRLEEARQQAARERRSFAIILYRGPHGTQRRPIYIECRSTGIVIRPEGITLTPEDLDGPLGPGNPLDAALRAIREHWARTETAARGEEPYPLLIVRPDGAVAYSVARAAMSSWEDEFGYELVDADMELTFPPSDPALKQVVEASIQTARQRQALLVAAMPSRFERSALPRESAAGGPEAWGSLLGANTGPSRSTAGGGAAGTRGSANLAQGYGSSPGTASYTGGGAPGSAAPSGSPGARSQAPDMLRAGYATTEGTLAATASRDGGSFGGLDGGLDGGPGSRHARTGEPGSGQPDGSSSGAATSGGTSCAGGSDAAGIGGDRSRAGTPEQTREGMPGRSASQRRSSSNAGEEDGDAAQDQAPGQLQGSAKSSTKTFDVGPSVSQRKLPGATGITRPIFLECHPDRLVILPDQGTDGKQQVVPIQTTMRNTIGPLATALRAHMERWGLAVAGGYWKPVLRVRVMPGAETQFEQLQSLLKDNGIDVQKKEEPRRYRSGGVSLPS